jgi:hypothetical protein
MGDRSKRKKQHEHLLKTIQKNKAMKPPKKHKNPLGDLPEWRPPTAGTSHLDTDDFPLARPTPAD